MTASLYSRKVEPVHETVYGRKEMPANTEQNCVYTQKTLHTPSNTFTKSRSYTLINLRPCKTLDSFVNALVPKVSAMTSEKIGVALSGEDEELLTSLQEKLSLSEIVRVKNFSDAESLWSGAVEAVGMRLHFGVLSVIFNTPVTLLPYDVKVSEFAKQFNIPVIQFAHEQAQD